MSTTFTGNETVGEIVSVCHSASNLMKEFGIDFCCGGNISLAAVLEERGIQSEAFLERLNQIVAAKAADGEATDYRELASTALIEHIMQRHHEYLREELPVLGDFVRKIMRVHGYSHPELQELYTLYFMMKAELEEHLVAEEKRVFPLIAQAERERNEEAKALAIAAIGEMESDHSKVGEILHRIRALTNHYELPPEVCRTYTLAFQKLEELESDLFQHIHLENNILFPRLQQQS